MFSDHAGKIYVVPVYSSTWRRLMRKLKLFIVLSNNPGVSCFIIIRIAIHFLTFWDNTPASHGIASGGFECQRHFFLSVRCTSCTRCSYPRKSPSPSTSQHVGKACASVALGFLTWRNRDDVKIGRFVRLWNVPSSWGGAQTVYYASIIFVFVCIYYLSCIY